MITITENDTFDYSVDRSTWKSRTKHYLEIIEFLYERNRLSSWENDFFKSVHRIKKPSYKQMLKIEEIATKYRPNPEDIDLLKQNNFSEN